MDDDYAKREIATLRNTLTWMDSVMANLSDGVFVVNDKWKVMFVNAALSSMVDSMRILMLSDYAWNVIPITQQSVRLDAKVKSAKLTIKDIAKLNGIYHLNQASMPRILELKCSYIKNVNQAVCVLTDVTLETKAMEKLHGAKKAAR